MPFSAGIGTATNSDGVVFSVDAPLVGDFNFGCNSIPETEKGFVISYGTVVHTEIRFTVSQKFSEALVLGVFYKYGLEGEKYRTFGVNFLAEL